MFTPGHVVILSEAKNLLFEAESDPSLPLRLTYSRGVLKVCNRKSKIVNRKTKIVRGCAMFDSTRRFSSRVDNYVKYRPSYPPEVVALLVAECGLTPDALVADVGSGTGLLAELFLKHGNHVF